MPNLDQRILQENDHGWVDDEHLSLSEADLTKVLVYFPTTNLPSDFDLPNAIQRAFRTFTEQLLSERFRGGNSGSSTTPKPSTSIARDMKALLKALEKIEDTLNGLDPATRTFIDLSLEANAALGEHGSPASFHDLMQQMVWPVDQLADAVMKADTQGKQGPANASQHLMITYLANLWELCHGQPPKTDKGRMRQPDPFLKLCQEFNDLSRLALTKHLKLPEGKKANIGSMNLSGIIAEVLQQRR